MIDIVQVLVLSLLECGSQVFTGAFKSKIVTLSKNSVRSKPSKTLTYWRKKARKGRRKKSLL